MVQSILNTVSVINLYLIFVIITLFATTRPEFNIYGSHWFNYDYTGAAETYQYSILALVPRGFYMAKTGDHCNCNWSNTPNHLQVSLSKFELNYFNNDVPDCMIILLISHVIA